MQTTKKTVDKKMKRETSKDDLSTKKPEDKLKKSIYSVSTPRNFIQKSTAADVYAKNSQVKAPKKAQAAVKNNYVSPMKDLLKSSPSSVSNRSLKTKSDIKTTNSARSSTKQANNTSKKVPFNVTVNSPPTKRKDLAMGEVIKRDKAKKDSVKDDSQIKKKTDKKEELNKKVLSSINVDVKNLPQRKRTKTRTLEDEEIKVLTPEVVENNTEMLNLTKQLKAQSKAFFVDLNEEKKQKKKEKSSDEEVSYEDDFESYESDFDSYQSETKSDEATTSDADDDNEYNSDDNDDDNNDNTNDKSDRNDNNSVENEDNSKEERMLDSGNFELRDPRSATKSKPMDFITEDLEEEQARADDERKKVSLVDEGFQDMSSGLSSMKTIHVDVLERPLFIDFTKSKENRRKKRIFEKLKQRAQIILSMVTLHEMSYNLFQMAPIPYDLYMATFGRLNYKQTAVQTYDDGITEEVQTDEILHETKWTQNPVEFSNNDIYLNERLVEKDKDLEQFTFFTNESNENDVISDSYKSNPLRIYLEQKNGVGVDAMLPYQSYELKLKDNTYNVKRLKKFLKNIESRVSNILNINAGSSEMSNIVKTSKIPFSNGYVSISTDRLEEKASFLKDSKIIGAIFSETKNNLIMSIHEKSSIKSVAIQKCVMCMWDLSITKREPLKYLIATDNVKIGRLSGGTDGYFVAALEDGSIHLWDLSEEATWCSVIDENSTKMVEINSSQTKNLTQTEKDREWNNKNSHLIDQKQEYGCSFQASAYTSSGFNICNNESIDGVVGLEFLGEHTAMNMVTGRKIIRQLCSLQRNGVLTTWSIIYEKTKNPTNDIGKAFWSKMYLERSQTTNLSEYLDIKINSIEPETDFNLNSAKKRLLSKRQEKNFIKSLSRQKSLSKSDRPDSAASVKNKRIMVESSVWDGIECCHLKIMNLNNVDNFLVGKNYGEVLCCRRRLGTIIIKRLNVANSASSITSLETSPNNLPHFLAASDCGTVSLCSLLDLRVLLTLDCRNDPTSTIDKYPTDHIGRFLGTVAAETSHFESNKEFKSPILSLCHTQPLSIVAVYRHNALIWDLKNSDSKVLCACAATACVSSERNLALLTPEGDIQVYKIAEDKEQIDLFNKYVALL